MKLTKIGCWMGGLVLMIGACASPSGNGGGFYVAPDGTATDSGSSSSSGSSGGTSSSSGGTSSGGTSSGGTSSSSGASSGGSSTSSSSSSSSSGGSSSCPNGTCEAGETETSCPQDCLKCGGNFTLGSTFYKSNDTTQVGAACSPDGAPKNCPDGYWITLKDSNSCVCIVSCSAFSTPKKVGEACNTSGSWVCQDITNFAGSSKGKFCVAKSWGLCQLGGGSSGSSGSSGGTSGGSSSGGGSSGGGSSSSSGGTDCLKAGADCEVNSECCSNSCDADFGSCDL